MPAPQARSDTPAETGIVDQAESNMAGLPASVVGSQSPAAGGPSPAQSAGSAPRSLGAIPEDLFGGIKDAFSGVQSGIQSVMGAFKPEQSGQGMHPMASSGIETKLDESVSVQKQMLEVLTSIQGNTDINKVAEVLAAAIKAVAPRGDNETIKRKGQRPSRT